MEEEEWEGGEGVRKRKRKRERERKRERKVLRSKYLRYGCEEWRDGTCCRIERYTPLTARHQEP